MVLIVVYFVGGIVINKYAMHKEGSDVIPQKSLWFDLPSLVKVTASFPFSFSLLLTFNDETLNSTRFQTSERARKWHSGKERALRNEPAPRFTIGMSATK